MNSGLPTTIPPQAIISQSAQQPPSQPQTRVPAFLNKLYALVNDPETDEYVRWNDAGTSFIIPNSQLMAEHVLPRSFKTINFASFVRQLNMYGFHKVPHLHDGALHTENAPEIWEFTNEYFTRDNPDLQSIVRKKNEAEKARSAKRQASPDVKPKPTSYPAIEAPMPNGDPSSADMALVFEEIRNIKRLQNSVIGELKRLKADNEALWTEAAEARARHDQQQATINKMLKFLSTVFSPTKPNAGSLSTRNRGLITGPSAFEELSDNQVDLSNPVLTPEAQETGARELSNLFGGAQPILPINAGDASWWQNLIKNDLSLPVTSYAQQPDGVALYNPPPQPLDQHRNSLAAMEQAVNQTDQSIGRIAGVLGVNSWENFDANSFQNFENQSSFTYDPLLDPQALGAQPDYQFDDFLRNTDEIDQVEGSSIPADEDNQPRFESLSREGSPKMSAAVSNQVDDSRKRPRSLSAVTQGAPPLQKKPR